MYMEPQFISLKTHYGQTVFNLTNRQVNSEAKTIVLVSSEVIVCSVEDKPDIPIHGFVSVHENTSY